MKHQLLTILLGSSVLTFAQQHDTITNSTIREVVITTKQLHKGISSKMPINYLETPQMYDVIDKSTIEAQASTEIKDVLINSPGLVRLWQSTGLGVTGGEYYTMRGFAFQPNLLNGLPSFNNGTIDVTNIEQIEVVKGPNGTLYGGNVISYGGLINIITKKPYDSLGGSITYTGGSHNLNRIALDINTPVSKKLFFRLNTAYHKVHSFQDAGYSESIFVAPSIQYNFSDRLKLYVDFQYRGVEAANAPMLFLDRENPLTFHSLDVFKDNYYKSYTNNDLTIKNPALTAQARLEYKINDYWTSNTYITRNNTRSRGYDQFLDDMSNGDEFTRLISKLQAKTDIFSIQHNLNGRFKIGTVENKFLFGLDYLSKKFSSVDGDYVDYGIVSLKNQTDSANLTKTGVDAALENSFYMSNEAKTETFSSYVSNVTDISPRLAVMASLRIDHLRGSTSAVSTERTHQTSLSPKFGIVYQPIPSKIAVFANYLNGFVFLDPAIISDENGANKTVKPFDPEQANQFEIGAKATLLQNKLIATMSLYHINVSNKLMTDMNTMNGFSQGGKVRSKGIEFSLSGSPIIGWNLITGFSHNDNKVTKSRPEDGNLGTRPEEAGPANTFNFWTNYEFQTGVLKNLSIGYGIYSLSSFKVINRTTIGQFALPSYTLMNTAISYTYKNATATLKVDNLTNKKYFIGNSTVNPQADRTFSLSINYKL
ncbi:TonB-dependent siderophore receptor [Myroides odoratimimus]|uniref:TonB-dependent siderophore receptor n=1 Tax=Myroides odoratimimus TaxID=76832 RepID=UPI003100F9A0